jgi:tetratricopeptide (TPR) repeat protein
MRRDGLFLVAAVMLAALTSATVQLVARESAPEVAPARAVSPDEESVFRRIAALEELLGRVADRLAETENLPAKAPESDSEPARSSPEPGEQIDAILRSDGNPDGKVRTLVALGHALTSKQDLEAAADALERAIDLAREGTEPAFGASYFLAWNEFERGRKAEALARLEGIAADERARPFSRGRAHWAATLFAYHLEERERALGHLKKLRRIEDRKLGPLVRDLENRLTDLDPEEDEDE